MTFWNGTEWVANAPPVARPASRAKRLAAATLEASLITALTFGLIASTAFAARGGGKPSGGGGGGTISLAPLVVDINADGLPNRGDVVTFNVATSATSAPYVNLVCSQNGGVVLNGWKGYWDGSLDTTRNFGLASGSWQSGAVDCTASLKMQTRKGWSTLASTSFHAGE